MEDTEDWDADESEIPEAWSIRAGRTRYRYQR